MGVVDVVVERSVERLRLSLLSRRGRVDIEVSLFAVERLYILDGISETNVTGSERVRDTDKTTNEVAEETGRVTVTIDCNSVSRDRSDKGGTDEKEREHDSETTVSEVAIHRLTSFELVEVEELPRFNASAATYIAARANGIAVSSPPCVPA
ncbi:hypothetical protein [Haloferax profundi]|uniref:hypothetical protein n=1 Tax=Haloferax profundi TaxID=1544718 RepID=UPI001E544EFC|nr:hypothetical protein [Haloferax profundi]